MKKKQALKVMGMVLAGSLVLSEAAPVPVRAAAAAQSSQDKGESQEKTESGAACYIDTENGSDNADGSSEKNAVKSLNQAVKLYEKAQKGSQKTDSREDTAQKEQINGYFVFCGMTEDEMKAYLEKESEGLKKGESVLPEGIKAVTSASYQSVREGQQKTPEISPVPGAIPVPDSEDKSQDSDKNMTENTENINPDSAGEKTDADDKPDKQGTPVPTETPEPTVTTVPTVTPEPTVTPTPAEIPETPVPTDTPESEPTPTPTVTPVPSPTETPEATVSPDTQTTPEDPSEKPESAGKPDDSKVNEDTSPETDQKTEDSKEESAGSENSAEEKQDDVQESNSQKEENDLTDGSESGQKNPEKEQNSILNGVLPEKQTEEEDWLLPYEMIDESEIPLINAMALLEIPEQEEEITETDEKEESSDEENRLMAEVEGRTPSASSMVAAAEAQIQLLKTPGNMIVGPDNYDIHKKPTQAPEKEESQTNHQSDPETTKSPQATSKPSGSKTSSGSTVKTPQKKTDTDTSIKTYPVQTGDTAMIFPLSVSTVLSAVVLAMLSALHIQSKRRERDLAWLRFRQENPLDGEKK